MLKRLLLAALLLLPFSAQAAVGDLIIFQDKYNRDTLIRPFSGSVMSRSLAANTAESISVPSGARFVLFGGSCNLFVSPSGTASVPGDVTDGSASEGNGAAYALYSPSGTVTSISVVADSACVVTAAFFK